MREPQRHALPAHPRAAALARSFVTEDCRHLSPAALHAALLLTTELVGNAVRHGTPEIALSIDCDGHEICVQVEDGAPALPEPRPPSVSADSGRGLLLVEAYADQWGVRRLTRGKCVWFTLGTDR